MLMGGMLVGPTTDGKIEVKLTKVTEVRIKEIAPKKEKESFFSFGQEPGLTLTARVAGGLADAAKTKGKLKIEQAADDTGTDLKPEKKKSFFSIGGGDDDFEKIGAGMIHSSNDDKKEPGFDMDIKLKVPARKAQKLPLVKGEFQIQAGGEEQVVEVKKPRSQRGKAVGDPVLEKAGLTVTVKDPTKQSGFFSGGEDDLSLEFKGDLSALDEIEVLDAEGEDASSGHMSSGSDDTKTYVMSMDKPLSDDMTVKIHLVVGLKTVTVPFEFKDVPLP
jgi:hypothetical protein